MDAPAVVPTLLICAVAGLTFGIIHLRLRGQGYRAPRRPPVRHETHAFDPSRSARIRGGSRVGLTNTTVPFVTLSLEAEWAHLSGIRPVWIDRGEVVAVRSVRASLPPSGHGVRFDTEDGVLDGVVFWTLSVDTVLDAFASHGWPVEPL